MNFSHNGLFICSKCLCLRDHGLSTIYKRLTQQGLWQFSKIAQISDFSKKSMSEDVQKQIVNPFFITKPLGKGTGIGMSIIYQIISEKHGS